jgi:sulfur transfer protein SufE
MAEELGAAQDPKARIKTLIGYSTTLEGLPQEDKVMKNRVMGCTAQVWRRELN